MVQVLGPDLDLRLLKSAFGKHEADEALRDLLVQTCWHQDNIVMFGKKMTVPRLSAWHGDPGTVYSYSNILLEPKPWFDCLSALGEKVEALAGSSFNSVLLNLYRDGSDSMGWHSDDEAELGTEPIIASLSLGATRKFHLRRRDDHKVKRSLELQHGDLLVMAGQTQAHWAHQIPKTARPVGRRLNLTFRTVLHT